MFSSSKLTEMVGLFTLTLLVFLVLKAATLLGLLSSATNQAYQQN